ncbi:MAG TPA: HD domain-containing phosphohydrolase [Burkholderiales bacterium]|nr:HD domain-containing phosphohydrolase [Burkholderiales bacterium]
MRPDVIDGAPQRATDTEQALRRELDSLAAELAERYEELHLVYSIDAEVRNFDGGWAVFQKLVNLCTRHLNVDVAALVYPGLDLTLSSTELSKPMFNLDLVLVELRGDLYRFIQAGRESVVINDARDPRRAYIFTDMPYKVLGVPLYIGGTVAAMLALVNHDDKPDFTASDRKLGEVMANQFSNLLHMCRMFEEQKTFNRQIVAALIEAVEAKDPYTRGHSERVRAIALDIGRELGIQDADLDALTWCSVLHDVGKIGIPDAVLCKPGPLTRDEYTFIKVHSERGCEILSHIERLQHVIPGLRHHHERFDGGGYPHGLAGSAIPLVSRIIAVADTYDAMTSSRAYRAGRSHAEAVAEIRRVSGSQLDPGVVSAFLRVCEREPQWVHTFGTLRAARDG